MKRIQLNALHSPRLRWDTLVAELPPTLESLGLVHDEAASGGEAMLLDLGDDGCVVLLPNVELARRAARGLATRSQIDIQLYEVAGTRGDKGCRFRTEAWRATATGELRPGEGRELDLEDREETWGGGTLEEQANRVLDLFANISRSLPDRTLRLGYSRRAPAQASSPRLAKLLVALQKAKSHKAEEQADGRLALRIELAAGGIQTSFCSRAEYEELEQLLAGKPKRARARAVEPSPEGNPSPA